MKILVVSQYYYPEDFRINDICEELVSRGHEVTVLTGLPNYPEGEIYQGFEKAYLKPEIHNGVKIVRFKCRPRFKGVLNLVRNYISFVFNGKKAIKKLEKDFDIVYAYQLSPITSVIPALKYKEIAKAPVILYVCDLWPESIRDKANGKIMSKRNLVFLMMKFLSRRIYNKADLICVKCEEFSDYLIKECRVAKRKCNVIYEHAESNYLSVSSNPEPNNIVDFMFLGNIGSNSNCELIIKAAALLKGENYKIHFVGDGSGLNDLKKICSDLNLLDKICFHGRFPQSKIIKFYNMADVCLLTLSNKSAIGLTPPAKLSSYMAASRPIIASASGATKRIIQKANCGFVCAPDSAEELAKSLQNVIDNPDIVKHLGSNGRLFFLEHLTLEKHLNDLIATMESLLSEKQSYNNRN